MAENEGNKNPKIQKIDWNKFTVDQFTIHRVFKYKNKFIYF